MKQICLAVSLLLLVAAGHAQVSANGSITASGSTCGIVNCVSLQLLNNQQGSSGGLAISLSGTWSATAQFEGSADCTNFSALYAYPLNSTTPASSATANGTWQANVAGLACMRVRSSAYSSGTIVVTLQASTASARSGGSGGGGGGGDTITSPNGTLTVGGDSSNTMLDLAGSAGQIMAGATPALTATPALGTDGSAAGTLQLANSAAAFHSTIGSAATANNTVKLPATVPTNLHTLYCAVASTTCTLTDTGYAYNAIPLADMAAQAANTIVGNVTGSSAAPTAAAAPAGGTNGCSGTTDAATYTAGTGWGCHQITAGSVNWDSIGNPSGNMVLSNGTKTSILSGTAATNQFFALKNATAAVVGTSQGSEILSLCGRAFHGSADVEDCLTLGELPGNGNDAAITFTIGHTGTSTGAVTTAFPGPVQAGVAGGVGGTLDLPEGTAASAASGHDIIYADSTAHRAKMTNNNGTAVNIAGVIATGTSAMGTSAISTGTCATVVTTSATGTLSTDAIIATPNADPTGVTGYAVSATGSLYIVVYPTADNVNFRVCNNTSGSLTPSALTMNWRVVR